MKIERGFLVQPDIVELMERFELFEVYTDQDEDEYRAIQERITGINANPTYIVLDSKTQLEVARSGFTNDKEEFVHFIEQGLSDQPVFRSTVHYIGLEIDLPDVGPLTVLTVDGPIEADPGQVVGMHEVMGASGVLEQVEKRAYDGVFTARHRLRVGEACPPGHYI
ncbi:MAG: hypothetical protein KDC38_16620, partial [Planctomycetes bacterium]|nr:hypothetical protein [Planctomycetota bacterium]